MPKELVEMSRKIMKRLSIQENDVFTCDFAWCAKHKKPFLIKLNKTFSILLFFRGSLRKSLIKYSIRLFTY